MIHAFLFLLSLAIGSVLIPLAALLQNRVPLQRPPGPFRRVWTHLTTHIAETSPVHSFPELRSRYFADPPQVLYERVLKALPVLGWRMEEKDDRLSAIHAVVSTPLWKFKDDVFIRVEIENRGSRIDVRSVSRIGRGDLGANTRHILDLHAALEGDLCREISLPDEEIPVVMDVLAVQRAKEALQDPERIPYERIRQENDLQ